MKFFLFTILFIFCLTTGYSQTAESSFRIFGEVSTVDNRIYKGFITWGETKNYWIDFFEASKMENPYSRLFGRGDGVFFYKEGQMFANPPVHVFACRFGNIRSIRPTGENEIGLELKNGEKIVLRGGNQSDINTNLEIATPTATIRLKWEYISEIRFQGADGDATPPELNQVAGIVKSSQGIYKGLITWNCNRKRSTDKNITLNTFLNKMQKVMKDKGALKVLPKENSFREPFTLNTVILYPAENIMINMPNIGSVIVPPAQFEELEIIPLSELFLLSYDDFKTPKSIKGEISTHHNGKVCGNLAYDLDESLDIEVLDGKNNMISYRIPFKYIDSIEPKNYKYSFITLYNGSQLSLGDAPDVNRENSGIIVSGDQEAPVYIPWTEVKLVRLKGADLP